LDAPQGLQRLDDRIEAPRRRALEQLGLEALEAIDLLIELDGIAAIRLSPGTSTSGSFIECQ
jgi:hypothetical protein